MPSVCHPMVLKKVIKTSNSEGTDSDPLMVYNRVNFKEEKSL